MSAHAAAALNKGAGASSLDPAPGPLLLRSPFSAFVNVIGSDMFGKTDASHTFLLAAMPCRARTGAGQHARSQT